MEDAPDVIQLDFETDGGAASRAAIGLVVLEQDESLESDLRRVLLDKFDGVAVYHSRIPSGVSVTVETLSEMAAALPEAVRRLPTAANLRSIGYACTSGSTLIGEARVQELVQSVWPGVPVTNPLTALRAACHALNVHKLALITPYSPTVSLAMRSVLATSGIEIVTVASFCQEEEATVARICPSSVLDAIVHVNNKCSACDAVFASCTNLRALQITVDAERMIKKPVLCSNQVLLWHLLRLSGIDDALPDLGKLADVSELPSLSVLMEQTGLNV